MEENEKVVTLDDITYVLRPYDVEKDIKLKDLSFDTDLTTGKRKLLLGTYQFYLVFFSVVSWNVKDKAGNPVRLTEYNFKRYVPKNHLNVLSDICEKLNYPSEEEKKIVSGQHVLQSDGMKGITSEKKG